MNAYLSIEKNGALSVIRVMPKMQPSEILPQNDFVRCFNALATANNAQELLFAIDQLPSILPYSSIQRLSDERLFRPSEFSNKLLSGFDEFDGETLRHQSHFDAGAQREDRKHTRAVNWVVKNRNAKTSKVFHKQLLSADDALDAVVVEPLADWVLVRNVLGLTARLAYLLQYGGKDDVLVEAQMEHAIPQRLGREVFRIPFSFNPYFYRWRINKETLEAKWDYERYMPLLIMLTGKPRRSGARPFTNYHYDFGSGKDVYLVTAPIAKNRSGSFSEEPDRRLWLCAEVNGRNQREVAERIVLSMAEAVRSLQCDGQLFGWEMDKSCYYDGSRYPKFVPHSLFAQLMLGLFFKQDATLGRCVECGNAIMDAAEGRPRSYCSEACRLKHIRRKQGDTDERSSLQNTSS